MDSGELMGVGVRRGSKVIHVEPSPKLFSGIKGDIFGLRDGVLQDRIAHMLYGGQFRRDIGGFPRIR